MRFLSLGDWRWEKSVVNVGNVVVVIVVVVIVVVVVVVEQIKLSSAEQLKIKLLIFWKNLKNTFSKMAKEETNKSSILPQIIATLSGIYNDF